MPQHLRASGRRFGQRGLQILDAIAGALMAERIRQMPIGDENARFAKARVQLNLADLPLSLRPIAASLTCSSLTTLPCENV